MNFNYPKKLLVFFIGVPFFVFSQTNHGFSFDNYNGIYGSTANPANSAQSKHRWHINGLSYNLLGTSDYGTINFIDSPDTPNGFNSSDFSTNVETSNNNNFLVSNSDVLLPSVLYQINEKHTIGLLLRSRAFSDYSNFNGRLWKNLSQGFEDETLENTFNIPKFNNTSQSWKEIGLNYGIVLVNSNYHFIKVGGTAKYLIGNGAVELRGDINGSYNDGVSDDLIINSGTVSYLNTFSANPNNLNETSPFIKSAFDFTKNGSGFGGDVGFVYEWRPRETNRVGVRNNSSAVNTYKLKISASILDIGAIKYEEIDNSKVRLENFNITSPTSLSKNTLNNEGFIATLKNTTEINSSPQQGKATFALPRSLNIGLDYIIFNDKNYYVNLNYVKALTTVDDKYTNTRLNLITVTPRYETQKFSAYLPITYENNTGVYFGAGFRYGPITIGSAALNSLFTNGKLNHIYFGLNLPLLEDVFR
ncbi:hypothetical protein CLV91_0725 [Maribacter vaceletii]|uniref:DUF5723 domain-containing protein n=1 Tax=Maribacter vaceletii TaxID=1206816 RepID=A0A495EFI1_9FLAO|nr:DUF5723 family protein [Maribacter vaceletii]RKR14647.1 hypothetical protein CLV91_0725 [Maribacter vaceletii]